MKIPVGQTIAPVTTTSVKFGGNLPSDIAIGTRPQRSSPTIYNSLGTRVSVRVEFTKIAERRRPGATGSVNWTYDDGGQPARRPDGAQLRPAR